MSHTIHYYFSPISPFTYLAGDQLENEAKGEIVYHPFDIGKVFAATGGVPVPQRSQQRRDYRMAELKRISARRGLAINFQPKHFPVDSRPASKLLLAVRDAGADVGALAKAILKAVWLDELDISDRETLIDLLESLSIETNLLNASEALDEQLDRETEAAIDAGVFGSPFYIVNDEPFWGQDRLSEMLELANS